MKASQDIPSDSYPPLVVVGELIDVFHFPDRWRAVFAPARAHVTDDRGQHIKDEAKTKAYRQAARPDTCRLLYLLAFVLAPLNTPLSLSPYLSPASVSIHLTRPPHPLSLPLPLILHLSPSPLSFSTHPPPLSLSRASLCFSPSHPLFLSFFVLLFVASSLSLLT